MRRFLFVILGVFITHSSLYANTLEHPSFVAVKTQNPPTIDGIIKPEEWDNAAVIENFTQIRPAEGAQPTEKTRIHVLYDAENIYFGIQCFDTEPDAIVSKQMQREQSLESDDVVQIVLDPFGDNRNGYFFAISAGGGKRDGLVDSSRNEVRTDWDTLWSARVQIDAHGWTAEVAIPLKNISFNSGAKDWGINFSRIIRRKQELIRWSTTQQSEAFLDFSRAGRMSGLVGLKQGLGLIVKPNGSIIAPLDGRNTLLRPGLDMSYKLSPSTTALITLNTDFAEVEVDQQTVNLTRFPLFLPEKRTFFLQDASIFSFGGIRTSPLPFYSRRIGIVAGKKKNIFAGLKVTGREGFLNFGLLDVQMYDDADLGLKNLLVGRVSANILEQSSVGFILTHGDPNTTGNNTVLGGDFNFRNSHVFNNQVIQANAFILGSFSDAGPLNQSVPSGSDADDLGFGVQAQYPNDDLSLSLFAGRYGHNFRPALGFIERQGTWELMGSTRYRFKAEGFIRRIDLVVQNTTFLNLDGTLQSSYGPLPGVEIEDEAGDILYAEHRFTGERLSAPFEIWPGVIIPSASYTNSRFYVFAELGKKRVFAPLFEFATGGFFGGRRTDILGGVTVRPSKYFLFYGSYGHIGTYLPQGDFKIHLISAKANITFSPELSWNTLVQYDSISQNAGLHTRIHYEISPGQEAFLVYNQGLNISDDFVLKAMNGEISFKLGMTFNF